MTNLIIITLVLFLFIVNLVYTRTMVYELKRRNNEINKELNHFKKYYDKLLDNTLERVGLLYEYLSKNNKENNDHNKIMQGLLKDLKESWLDDVTRITKGIGNLKEYTDGLLDVLNTKLDVTQHLLGRLKNELNNKEKLNNER